MVTPSERKDAALVEYLEESAEMLDRFASGITKFEADQSNKEIIAAIYRDMHTIKGASHLFGFSQIGDLAHTIETCLDPIRKGLASAPPALVDILYDAADVMQQIIAGIQKNSRGARPTKCDSLNNRSNCRAIGERRTSNKPFSRARQGTASCRANGAYNVTTSRRKSKFQSTNCFS